MHLHLNENNYQRFRVALGAIIFNFSKTSKSTESLPKIASSMCSIVSDSDPQNNSPFTDVVGTPNAPAATASSVCFFNLSFTTLSSIAICTHAFPFSPTDVAISATIELSLISNPRSQGASSNLLVSSCLVCRSISSHSQCQQRVEWVCWRHRHF